MRRLALILGLTALAGGLAAGCGRQATTSAARHAPLAARAAAATPSPASLVLDFTPNAIHSGIYLAKARGYDRQNGVDLRVVVPGQSTDAVRLLDTGKVDFAILDIHDLALADAQGRGLVGIMAVIERPLASVIAQPQFKTPKQLTGQRIGVSGDPSDLAVLRSTVAGAGGNPAALKTVTIGYDAVPDMIGGKVAAVTAFWNDEGVQLRQAHRGFHIFRVEDYGAPAYPELVVCATRAELKAHPALARGLVHALVQGYKATLADPKAAESALESGATGLQTGAVHAQLQGELPALTPPGGGSPGALKPSVLSSWSRWEAKFGIVKRPPDVAAMFDTRFLPKS